MFSKNKLYVACKTALLSGVAMGAMPVFADDESKAAPEIEVIEVQGIRSSLGSAINGKRDAESILDSIVSEDIGKSSDESIAEALSRVSGVSLDRNGSDTQTVTVRGVTAALNNVTLNGVAMTSSTDNQAVDLSLFSADILSRIDVVKSPSANQEEGSLGASINLKTFAPLAAKSDRQVVSVEARHNELSEETTPRVSFSFLEKFSETIGLSGSFFYDQQDQRKDEYNIYSNRIRNGAHAKTTVYDAASGEEIDGQSSFIMPWFLLNRVNRDDKKKVGGTATFQLRPSEDTDMRFDLSFSRNEIDHLHSSARLHNFKNTPNALYIDRDSEGSDSVVGAYTQKIGGLNQSGNWLNTTDSLILGAEIEHTINDNWEVSARIGHSSTEQEFTDGYRTAWVHLGKSGNEPDSWCGFEMAEGANGDQLPVQRFCDVFDPTNPDNMQLSAVRSDRREVEDKKSSVYFDVTRFMDEGFVTSIEMGVKYTDRSKFVYGEEVFLNKSQGNFENEEQILASAVSNDNITGDNFLDGIAPDGAITGWLMPNSAEAVALAFPSGLGDGTPNEFKPNPLKAWEVEEKTYGGYVQVNYQLLDEMIIGNFGVRYAGTEITGTGASGIRFASNMPFLPENSDGYVVTDVTDENDYHEWLPSFTMNYLLSDEFIVRTSLARVLARPQINEVRPGYDIKAQNIAETPQGSGGNTQLEPFLADQFDLSVEWYFDEGALLSAALFKKDFKSFGYKTGELRQIENPFTGQCIVDRTSFAADDPERLTATSPCVDVFYSTSVNGASATVEGLELSYQQNYDFLPGVLKHLGSTMNYTYADSESIVDPENAANAFNGLPFLNTSKHSSNITAFWENDWASLRLAYSYRSKAISQTTHFNSTLVRDDREVLDFSANFSLSKDLKLTVSANNLTDSYDRILNVVTLADNNGEAIDGIVKEVTTDIDDVRDDRLSALYNFGRSYRISLRYTF